MRCLSRSPGPPLNTAVESLWYFEGETLEHATERLLPTARSQIVVNLAAEHLRWFEVATGRPHRMTAAVVSGAYDRAFGIHTADQRCVTGVCFRPGGAAALMGGVVSAFANAHVDLAALPGFDGLREALLRASVRGPQHVLDTWQRHLEAMLDPEAGARARFVSQAAAHLERGLSVQAVADALGLSVRKLRDDFRFAVGLPPKSFARIRRLQRALRRVAGEDASSPNWADIAITAGYFDQAHMVHEFRRLTGATPTAYLPRGRADHNHAVVR